MTRSPSPLTEPYTRGSGALFADALAGADGTADPAVSAPVPEIFADALAAASDGAPSLSRRSVPVVQALGTVTPPVAAEYVPSDPRMSHAAEQEPDLARDAAQGIAPPYRSGTQRPVAQPGLRRPTRPAPGPPHRAAGTWPPPGQSSYSQSRTATPGAPSRSMPPGRPSYPPRATTRQAAPRPVRNAAVDRRAAGNSRRSAGAWGAIFAALVFLLISGAGRQLLDAVMDLLNR